MLSPEARLVQIDGREARQPGRADEVDVVEDDDDDAADDAVLAGTIAEVVDVALSDEDIGREDEELDNVDVDREAQTTPMPCRHTYASFPV